MHWRYLSYVVRHKWFVLIACVELVRAGAGGPCLLWQGIVHDWSKFLPDEWMPYARYFYGGPWETEADVWKFYPPEWRFRTRTKEDVDEAFDVAWLMHQHRNPHHWQHWVLREDSGATKVLDMPYRFVIEMAADWRGAGLAQGKPDTGGWYKQQRENQALSYRTRNVVEATLSLMGWLERKEAGT